MEIWNGSALAEKAPPLQLELLVEDNVLAPDLFAGELGLRRRLEFYPACAEKRDKDERRACCDQEVKDESDLDFCYDSYALYPDCAIKSD